MARERRFRPIAAAGRALGFSWALTLRLVLLAAVGLLGAGCVLLGLCFPAPALLCLAGIAVHQYRHAGARLWSHGTARWADAADLYARNMLGGRAGLILGRFDHSAAPVLPRLLAFLTLPLSRSADACRTLLVDRNRDGVIRLNKFTHICTVAPSGKGKGTAYIIPNLLSWPGSVVVFDPKGENARLTARHRARAFGHRIVHINPWRIDGMEGHCLNVLEFIDPASPQALDEIRALAAALVIRSGKEHDSHWLDSAELFITAAIALVVCHGDPGEKNLQTVRDLLASPVALENATQFMCQSDSLGGMLRRLGHSLGHYVDRERGSVLSTTNRLLAWLDSPAIAACTRSSSFDPRRIRGRMSVYVTIPENQLEVQAPFLRLVMTALLRAVTAGGADERNPVLFVLDEAAELKRLPAVESAVSLLRGYGVRLWFFYQSPDQVKECFPEEAKFWDNMATQIYFGLGSVDSAKKVADRLGNATIQVLQRQAGTSRSKPAGAMVGHPPQPGQHSVSHSVTVSEAARQLMQPSELMTMGDDRVIVFHDNCHPILARKLPYFDRRAHAALEPRRLGLSFALTSLLTLAFGLLIFAGAGHVAFGWLATVGEPSVAGIAPLLSDPMRVSFAPGR